MTPKNDGLNVFSFVRSINETKEDILAENPEAERIYEPFVVNRSLSYFNDSVLYANEMNRYHLVDSAWQYSFLINTIRRRKRFSKWIKPSELDFIEVVKEYYGYSNEKAREALTLLSQDQLNELKQRVYKGGINKSNNDDNRPRERDTRS